MKWSVKTTLAVLVGLLLILVVGVVWVQGMPRELARRNHPDGTFTVVVGKPRLAGMMGIEIVLQECASDGTVTFASVQDLLGSWEDAIRKYKNVGGGGLLAPQNDPSTIELDDQSSGGQSGEN